MGVDTARYKLSLRAFAVLAAIAGVFLTHFNGGIGPSEASIMKSVRYVASSRGRCEPLGYPYHERGPELLSLRDIRIARRTRSSGPSDIVMLFSRKASCSSM